MGFPARDKVQVPEVEVHRGGGGGAATGRGCGRGDAEQRIRKPVFPPTAPTCTVAGQTWRNWRKTRGSNKRSRGSRPSSRSTPSSQRQVYPPSPFQHATPQPASSRRMCVFITVLICVTRKLFKHRTRNVERKNDSQVRYFTQALRDCVKHLAVLQ